MGQNWKKNEEDRKERKSHQTEQVKDADEEVPFSFTWWRKWSSFEDSTNATHELLQEEADILQIHGDAKIDRWETF